MSPDCAPADQPGGLSLNVDPTALRPVIKTIVAEVVAQLRDDEARLGDQLAYSETTAARLLDLNSHQLRDERCRGKITASRIVGNKVRYLKQDLLNYLAQSRINE